MDYKLELVVVPVSDVDRAKAFYLDKMGFQLDVDHQPNEHFRVVQMTPQGSACSITIGKGVTQAAPGCIQGLHLVVTDIEVAHAELTQRGVQLSEIFHFEEGKQAPGPEPDRRDYNSFASFSDPDGNTWLVQEVGRSKSTA